MEFFAKQPSSGSLENEMSQKLQKYSQKPLRFCMILYVWL